MIRLSRLLILSAMSLVLSLSSPAASAQQTEDFTVGLDQIALEQYENAFAIFQNLMPLGSSDAAYMLGLMSIEERGTEYNPVASLAYLRAARAWGNGQAQAMIEQIEPHLSAAELAEADEYYAKLNSEVAVAFQARDIDLDSEPPEATSQPNPQISQEIAFAGDYGWLEVIIAISPEGKIVAMQPLNTAHRDFLAASGRAFRDWQYEESEKVSITTLVLDYTMGNPNIDAQADVLEAYNQASRQANVGVTEEQFYVGGLTEALERYGSEQVAELPAAFYWYERAARNGNLQAQRFLALRYTHPEWAEHLIAKGDIDVMAWHGTRLLAEASSADERQRGRELLERAAEAGSSVAEDLLKQF